MKVLFAGQIAKDLSFPDANEDAFVLDADRGKIVVSDGASESFDSKTWARLLTTRFVRDSKLTQSWLEKAAKDYTDMFNQSQMSWSKQAAFRRGSFASLLGIEMFSEHGTIRVLGVGDSLAVLLDGEKFIESFPYVFAAEFQQRPVLFCTNTALNTFFSSPDFFSRHQKFWSITDKTAPIVLCMTDALGEWAIRHAQTKNPMWKILNDIKEMSDFENLVLRERQAKNMRIDDTTLIKLSFGDS